ncbi:MAG: hypothetical protein JJT81_01275 [Rubellimicrobium sp.]|nr:hypothetical protein [Rubellimicrobium sp.]
MRKALTVLGLLAASAAGAQDNPIRGIYGDEGGCARAAGRATNSDMVFLLAPDRIERWESTCPITRIAGLGKGRWQIDVLCSGEGESWTDSYTITPLPGEEGFTIVPTDRLSMHYELRPCP